MALTLPNRFVREGGELCLSESTHGTSVIRYWPKFLSEKGNDLMMNRLRRYCRWHQKQVRHCFLLLNTASAPARCFLLLHSASSCCTLLY